MLPQDTKLKLELIKDKHAKNINVAASMRPNSPVIKSLDQSMLTIS